MMHTHFLKRQIEKMTNHSKHFNKCMKCIYVSLFPCCLLIYWCLCVWNGKLVTSVCDHLSLYYVSMSTHICNASQSQLPSLSSCNCKHLFLCHLLRILDALLSTVWTSLEFSHTPILFGFFCLNSMRCFLLQMCSPGSFLFHIIFYIRVSERKNVQ